MKTLKSILLVFVFFTNYSFAEIYKWVDDKGVIHYSENKPEKIAVEEFYIQSYNKVVIEHNDKGSELKSNKKEPSQSRKRSKKVVMYSAEWCGVCKKAKKYFKNANIRYTNYDIDKSKSARARYNKLGAKGVPVILVGNNRMNGFSIGSFKQLYK